MDTDRELLELAAKAAGIEYRAESGYRVTGTGATGMPLLENWNPLTDDGDALRLVAALRECEPQINVANDGCQVQAWTELVQEDCAPDGDHCANLRRAIVRFAAEIGKAMP